MRERREQEPGKGPMQESALDRALLEYVRDPGLWPVLVVAVLIAATFGAALLLFALRLRNPFALAALALTIGVSLRGLEPSLRARRLRPAGAILLGLWTASGALAGGLIALGVF